MSFSTLTAQDECDRQFLDFHEQYVSKYIQLADAKAGFAIAVASALLAYLLSEDDMLKVLRAPSVTWTFAIVAASDGMTALSAACSFLVIVPRRPASGQGFVFWRQVAEMKSGTNFAARVRLATPIERNNERFAHSYALSSVCDRKYDWLRWSMLIGSAGAICAFWGRLLVAA